MEEAPPMCDRGEPSLSERTRNGKKVLLFLSSHSRKVPGKENVNIDVTTNFPAYLIGKKKRSPENILRGLKMERVTRTVTDNFRCLFPAKF